MKTLITKLNKTCGYRPVVEHMPSTRVAFSSIDTTGERGGEEEGRKEGQREAGRTIGNFSGQSPLTYKRDGEPRGLPGFEKWH